MTLDKFYINILEALIVCRSPTILAGKGVKTVTN